MAPPTPNDDLAQRLAVLPAELRERLVAYGALDQLLEVVLDLGRPPEARFADCNLDLRREPLRREDLVQSRVTGGAT